jgi:hypothetical protein
MNDKKRELMKAQIKQREEKLLQLKAQFKAIEDAQKALTASQARKDDTRRKIVSGAFLLTKMEKDESFRVLMFDELDASLTRNDERRLFGFKPIQEKEKQKVSELNFDDVFNSVL